ncbi:VanZ family protein [Fusibacter sp. 3D3]|uniref:VanZ family protein n=1 Tax=Fusibacter sp. 3D3 TaxID=1048380 RepID=UPI000852D1B6|nr:VanZ family protein [Fusibacter sp. 3D3]GAU77746.1 acetobutylicum phosphotransbutyrylase [Fusibacter sp. 3D3]
MKTFLSSKKIRWLMVLLWMLLIFAMSHLDVAKSWVLTGHVMIAIEKNTVGNDIKTDEMSAFEEMNYYNQNEMCMILLRKAAHVFEFFGLSLSLVYAFSLNNTLRFTNIKTMAFGLVYASFDEAHQLLIVGRTGNVRDVGIDMIGVMLGILVAYIVVKRLGRLNYEN